jgi:hypothetical protein
VALYESQSQTGSSAKLKATYFPPVSPQAFSDQEPFLSDARSSG